MSGTGRWYMEVQASPDYQLGWDDAVRHSGDRRGYASGAHGAGSDAYAYSIGWADAVDYHSDRPGEP